MVQQRALQRRRLALRGRRLRAAGLAVAITLSLLIGVGAAGGVPWLGGDAAPRSSVGTLDTVEPVGDPASRSAPGRPARPPSPAAERKNRESPARPGRGAERTAEKPLAVPPASGSGRRVIFSESKQRVWLVGAEGRVRRTYPVSGSRFDNLDPGSYAVQSRSRHAVAFDYSGTMEYFVRFTTGVNAPIGFHSVPVDTDGRPEQTKTQLGTPLSAGCVRQ